MLLIFFSLIRMSGSSRTAFHPLRIGDEIGGDIAAIELHAFDDVQRGGHGLGFFDRDDAILADLLHRFGNQIADRLVVVGGNGADLGDFRLVLAGLADLLQLSTTTSTALSMPRLISIGFAPAVTFLTPSRIDGLGQNGRGRGAVTGHIAGLAGDFADQLGAHVFVGVLELDFLGDGHAVLRDRRGAEFLVENRVAALRAERRLHGIGELVDPSQDGRPELPRCTEVALPSCSSVNVNRRRGLASVIE